MPVVTKVHRVSENDRATQDQNGQQFIQFWRVEFDASLANLPFGTPFDAVSATDGTNTIPIYGANLTGTSLYVVNKTAQVNPKSPNVCDVYVTFGPVGSISLRIEDAVYAQPVITDCNGNRIISSNKQPYPREFNPEKFDKLITAVITTQSPPTNYDALQNYVNSASITFSAQGLSQTCAAGTARLTKSNAAATYQIGSWAQYTLTYEWKYRIDGWREVVPDSGYAVVQRSNSGSGAGGGSGGPVILDSNGNTTVRAVLDSSGRPYSTSNPFYLDGNGNKLPDSATSCILGPNSDGTWGTNGAADAAGVQHYFLGSMNAMLSALGIGS